MLEKVMHPMQSESPVRLRNLRGPHSPTHVILIKDVKKADTIPRTQRSCEQRQRAAIAKMLKLLWSHHPTVTLQQFRLTPLQLLLVRFLLLLPCIPNRSLLLRSLLIANLVLGLSFLLITSQLRRFHVLTVSAILPLNLLFLPWLNLGFRL